MHPIAMTRAVSALLLLTVPLSCRAPGRTYETDTPIAPGSVVLTPQAMRIHRSAIVVDGHNDLPWAVRAKGESSFDKLDIAMPQNDLHTDIPRLRTGGVGAQFWSAFVPPDTMRAVSYTHLTLPTNREV